ncbi:hypothetical protein [Zeaxanthinibacter enoshimensis]|uniref:hypothetical protein n=1 Tax=Zeaxanthinibacter enoshimensis TaxID=392009 RepID=UPI003566E991
MQTVVKYFTAAIFSFFGYIVTGDSREASATHLNSPCVVEEVRHFSLQKETRIRQQDIRLINLNPAASTKSCSSTTC